MTRSSKVIPFSSARDAGDGATVRLKSKMPTCRHTIYPCVIDPFSRAVTCGRCGSLLDPVDVLLEMATKDRLSEAKEQRQAKLNSELEQRMWEKELDQARMLVHKLKILLPGESDEWVWRVTFLYQDGGVSFYVGCSEDCHEGFLAACKILASGITGWPPKDHCLTNWMSLRSPVAIPG
jgi:hypothetical protein